jgi:hypothetical protein
MNQRELTRELLLMEKKRPRADMLRKRIHPIMLELGRPMAILLLLLVGTGLDHTRDSAQTREDNPYSWYSTPRLTFRALRR